MKIKTNDVGLDYYNELKGIIDIKIERGKMYGDSYKEMSIVELETMIKMKLRRYEYTKVEESKKDSLIDLVNYTIFLLCKLSKEGKNGK